MYVDITGSSVTSQCSSAESTSVSGSESNLQSSIQSVTGDSSENASDSDEIDVINLNAVLDMEIEDETPILRMMAIQHLHDLEVYHPTERQIQKAMPKAEAIGLARENLDAEAKNGMVNDSLTGESYHNQTAELSRILNISRNNLFKSRKKQRKVERDMRSERVDGEMESERGRVRMGDTEGE